MISCETGKVKITGEIDEIKAEATVLMNAMYGTICKEVGEESADKFFDKLTKREKMSKLRLISDVLGCIGECAGGFEKDKKYIFDKDTYIKDMKSSDGFDDKDLEFASNYDGEEVEVIASSLGLRVVYALNFFDNTAGYNFYFPATQGVYLIVSIIFYNLYCFAI